MRAVGGGRIMAWWPESYGGSVFVVFGQPPAEVSPRPAIDLGGILGFVMAPVTAFLVGPGDLTQRREVTGPE